MGPSVERHKSLEAAGWKPKRAGAFMDLIGPLWARLEETGWAYGLLAEDRHLNPAHVVHGGFLQSLIDHALSALAWEAVERKPCMTLQSDSHFLSTVKSNDFVVAHGMEVRRTRNMIFMRGHLEVQGKSVLSAQAVFKVAERNSATASSL